MSAHASVAAPACSSATPTCPAPCPYAFALTTAITFGGTGRSVEEVWRNEAIAARFERTAARETRATFGRITPSISAAVTPRPRRSLGAVREVLEARVFLDERELRRPDGAVA